MRLMSNQVYDFVKTYLIDILLRYNHNQEISDARFDFLYLIGVDFYIRTFLISNTCEMCPRTGKLQARKKLEFES